MSLNWREIDLVLEELSLVGARIQRITQPRYTHLLLELYHRHETLRLLVSMEQGKTRIHRTSAKFSKPSTPPRFQQLLQSRVRGAVIRSVEHVHQDRILRFELARSDERHQLWVRLWGGSANVLLTDPEGTIIDAMYRRPKRGETGGYRFAPEPPDVGAQRKAMQLEVREFLSGAVQDHDYPYSSAIEKHYAERESEERVARAQRDAEKLLTAREAALRRRLDDLERKIEESKNSDRYKVIADAIMTQLHEMEPGRSGLTVENPYDPSELLEIRLDPTKTAVQNAEHYYQKHKKAARAAERARRELEDIRRAHERTSADLQNVRTIEDPAELERLTGEKKTNRARSASQSSTLPGLQFRSGRLQLYLGRTARENDELLRRHVRGNDLWMHVRDRPGPYVFVRVPKGKTVPLEALLDGGTLALAYSKAKPAGRALVQYTQVKNLRRAKDGPQGRVIPYNEKTIEIELDPERLTRLREALAPTE